VEGENMKYSYCESLQKNQRVDENGNSEATDNVNNNFITDTREMILLGKGKNDNDLNSKPKKQIDQKINRLQAMAISDDEDYGKALN
jgi:hypothetical protein